MPLRKARKRRGRDPSLEDRLREELERLKRESGLGHSLEVRWVPDPSSSRHGEVKGTTIYIYDEDGEGALQTLKHEFVDYVITKGVVEPLIKYINLQKCLFEDQVYKRKERLVDGLLRLL